MAGGAWLTQGWLTCCTCRRYERQLRACGFVGVTILWARFGFVTWIAHKRCSTKEEHNEEEEQEEEEQEAATVSLEEEEEEQERARANSPALLGSPSPSASSFIHWMLTGALQTDAASAVAFSSGAQDHAFEVCAWGLSQVRMFDRDCSCSRRRRGRQSLLL